MRLNFTKSVRKSTFKKFGVGLLMAALATPALACTALPPAQGFVFTNDKNSDGVLNFWEWRKAKSDDFLLKQQGEEFELKIGGLRTFRALDVDNNWKISMDEAAQRLEYREHPCASWERAMNEMLKNQALIKE
ncbi:hypothetical protein B0181_01675 [Moraxella caviae]|uniref:EF-hand domain-containing protein n=1 Tax=Moraxella caviae TaxID=34060 RepID=A0A1T0A9U4_9GAMM|nr:hypothetical protein [Moraxella caviae]OOR92473.1 hypothetical protein B0181_01675 [Moraxella caviae]STZ13739.1 Uncharacterised protein [Moraxella caviae]STZ13821.1 Uncharacterised protein [Moraxella caviae]VEW10610.1 Uncharacterised protein [Moraxella caviae]